MTQYIMITGASSGLGRSAAVELSKKYNIIICGRNVDELKATSDMCSKINDIKIWNYDLKECDGLEKALKEYILLNEIQISGFVHCAGISKLLPVRMYQTELFEESYRVNVISAALIVKILSSKRVNAQALKSVVFVSSTISNYGTKAYGIYGSSKSALDGLMRNLAVELAPKVRVNSVLPGGMKTPMTKSMYENTELVELMRKNTPLDIGEPKNVVPMIEFLLSEGAEWITGQMFVVDGGRTVNITEQI